MKPHYTFGLMLSDGIKKTALERRQRHGQTHIDLAHYLNVAPTTLYGWRKGERLPAADVIPKLASIFVREGKMDAIWIDKFIHTAQYGPPQAASILKQNLFGYDKKSQQQSANAASIHPDDHSSQAPPQPDSRLAKISPDWTERVFIWFIQLEDRFADKNALMLIAFLGLWLAAWSLLRPFLNWPYPNSQIALKAGLQYSLVSLALPFIICLLSQIGAQGEKLQAARTSRRALWTLRCAAAYIGYHLVMVVGLTVVIFLYSAGLTSLMWLQAAIPALALLLAYVFAQRYPPRRINAKTDSLAFYPSIDIPVLTAFIIFGPLLAFAFYFIHPYLLQPYLGSIMLLLSLALVAGQAILEKQASPRLSRFVTTIPFILALILLLLALILAGLIAWFPR